MVYGRCRYSAPILATLEKERTALSASGIKGGMSANEGQPKPCEPFNPTVLACYRFQRLRVTRFLCNKIFTSYMLDRKHNHDTEHCTR